VIQHALRRLRPARRFCAVPVMVFALVLTVGAAAWACSNGVFHASRSKARPASAVFNRPVVPQQGVVQLEDPGFIQNSGGAKGWANIRAVLHCTVSATVNVRFQLVQQRSTADDASLNVPCTTGTDVRVFSDFLGTFHPGSAQVVVTTTANGQTTTMDPNVRLASWSSTIAHLRNALRGPNGDQVAAQLEADLAWRSQFNPKFHTVWIAALSGQPSPITPCTGHSRGCRPPCDVGHQGVAAQHKFFNAVPGCATTPAVPMAFDVKS